MTTWKALAERQSSLLSFWKLAGLQNCIQDTNSFTHDDMKRVYLQCHGRLGNLLICWATAREFLCAQHLIDYTIALQVPFSLKGIEFPGTIIEPYYSSATLCHVTRNHLKDNKEDCLWVWEDVFQRNMTQDAIRHLRSINLLGDLIKEMRWLNANGLGLGIHFRCGDFITPELAAPDSPFIRGSHEFYLMEIEKFRQENPEKTIFIASDGEPEEIEFLTRLENVRLGRRHDPVYDLFNLSTCSKIIGSDSTFSEVAAAYGGVPLIKPK